MAVALALAGPRAALAGPAGWGRSEQVGIQPQAGDQADGATPRGDQLEAGEAAVADDGDGALRQPAPGLQDRLDGPAGQRLVAPGHARRWRAARARGWSGTAVPSAASPMGLAAPPPATASA